MLLLRDISQKKQEFDDVLPQWGTFPYEMSHQNPTSESHMIFLANHILYIFAS